MVKTYSELIKIPTFDERFEYLRLKGKLGKETFGADRYLNQILYGSNEWKRFRREIAIRDNGCDLALPDREIFGMVLVHHINPITIEDIENRSPMIFDPENVVCVSKLTHNAIHYGSIDILPRDPIERSPNDTCPWRTSNG